MIRSAIGSHVDGRRCSPGRETELADYINGAWIEVDGDHYRSAF
jgi:hypothetical protein